MDEGELITDFLAPYDSSKRRHSMLSAAMRDAQFAFTPHEEDGPQAMWLGALGCLIALDVLGAYVRLRRSGPAPAWAVRPMQRALTDFSTDFGDEVSGKTLWALRCAIAHEFGLKNPGEPGLAHVFKYEHTGPLITLPDQPWNGELNSAWRKTSLTRINLAALPELVSSIVGAARDAHMRGAVILADGMRADVMNRFAMFRTTEGDELPLGFSAE